MATIEISDLRPAGSELFLDSESYLNEVTNEEMNNLSGGDVTWGKGWFTVRNTKRHQQVIVVVQELTASDSSLDLVG